MNFYIFAAIDNAIKSCNNPYTPQKKACLDRRRKRHERREQQRKENERQREIEERMRKMQEVRFESRIIVNRDRIRKIILSSGRRKI